MSSPVTKQLNYRTCDNDIIAFIRILFEMNLIAHGQEDLLDIPFEGHIDTPRWGDYLTLLQQAFYDDNSLETIHPDAIRWWRRWVTNFINRPTFWLKEIIFNPTHGFVIFKVEVESVKNGSGGEIHHRK